MVLDHDLLVVGHSDLETLFEIVQPGLGSLHLIREQQHDGIVETEACVPADQRLRQRIEPAKHSVGLAP